MENISRSLCRLVLAGILSTSLLSTGHVAVAETAAAVVVPAHLTCESMHDPLGIGNVHPRLSWQMVDARRGARQTVYEVSVASSAALLKAGKSDVWSSGKVNSAQSVDVPYEGPALQSGHRYYWHVRIWDENGKASEISGANWWEMGLLLPADWQAKWIANDSAEQRGDRESKLKWIWTAGEPALTNPKNGEHQFRLDLSLAQKPVEATLFITGKDTVAAWVNGTSILKAPAPPAWGPLYTWGTFRTADVTDDLKQGKNLLAAEVNINNPGNAGTAGMIALLRVRMPDGSIQRFISGPEWKSAFAQTGDWSSPNYDDSSWQQAEVAANIGEDPLGTPWPPEAASYLRKTFSVHKQVRSARLYATALGSYIFHLNGQRVGKQILAPGWTDYRHNLIYQAYDVTRNIHSGENALGALLGDGWYASGLTWTQQRYNYGPPPNRLLAQLVIEYTDGSQQVVSTGQTWKAAKSPILSSDIYNGEDYDATRAVQGWDESSFSASKWSNATVEPTPPAKLEAQDFQPIRVEQVLTAKSVKNAKPGVYVFDMGQNMVGWERLHVKGPRGTKVTMCFGEVLDANGHFYQANMRTAKETDTYVLSGRGEETFEPHFTYHGFRYVEVTGYPGVPSKDAIEGVVFHTDAPLTSQFHTGNAMVNQLWSNILWGQRGNFMSVPTDCPQRDERLGWMGDAEVFWRTASYNMNLDAFSHRFTQDIRVAQSPQGAYWDISPRVGTTASGGNPGWGDAGVIIPYTTYLQYGDVSIIQSNWGAMTKWMDYIKSKNPSYVWRIQATYGDWLAIGSKTPNDLIATAYWAYDATLMARMADALHKPEEAARYRQLFSKVKDAFDSTFVKSDGTVGSGSQTSYVLALHMDLLPDSLRAAAADKLAADIKAHNWHLTTGFLGTPYIMLELSKSGHSDVAYKLLFQKTYPSWGYMIEHGATTMWERWNGNQMLGDPGMNSFNHYSYGAVGEWLYRYVAGIDDDYSNPGFHHILLNPQFDASLGQASSTYDSTYGPISSAWKYSGNTIAWKITIPANTTASLYLPEGDKGKLLESGKPVSFQKQKGTGVIYTVPAGTYSFTMAR